MFGEYGNECKMCGKTSPEPLAESVHMECLEEYCNRGNAGMCRKCGENPATIPEGINTYCEWCLDSDPYQGYESCHQD